MGREPMKVRWAIEGWDVRRGATDGQQVTSWMSWGGWEHAARAARARLMKKWADQAVCSEDFRMMALPVNSEDMIGLRRLWN